MGEAGRRAPWGERAAGHARREGGVPHRYRANGGDGPVSIPNR